MVSDGLGGIVLTAAGTTRAGGALTTAQPGPTGINLDGNIHRGRLVMDWGQPVFLDHWIKGQLPHVRSAATKAPAALDASVAPLGQGRAAASRRRRR